MVMVMVNGTNPMVMINGNSNSTGLLPNGKKHGIFVHLPNQPQVKHPNHGYNPEWLIVTSNHGKAECGS